MRPNFQVKISEQFTIHECMRPFKGSVNMDLYKDVDEDDYLRKEVSCSKASGTFENMISVYLRLKSLLWQPYCKGVLGDC